MTMINKDTKLYGSFSDKPGNNGCMFFNKGFKKHKIDAIYKSFYSTNIKKTEKDEKLRKIEIIKEKIKSLKKDLD